MIRRCVWFFVCLITAQFPWTLMYRIYDEMAVDLSASFPCFRILNGTHQTGCQSKMDGSSGVIQLVTNFQHIDYIKKDPDGRAPFIALLTLSAFKNKLLMERLWMIDDGKVAGLIVIRADPVVDNLSEDNNCPNRHTCLYTSGLKNHSSQLWENQSCQNWNEKYGLNYRFMDLKFPAFYVQNSTEISWLLEKCYGVFNSDSSKKWPFCSANLGSFHVAAQNTATCIRRSQIFAGLHTGETICDPIADFNVRAWFPNVPTDSQLLPLKKQVIILATRMDTFSLFYDTAQGARTSLPGVIVLLAIADVLRRSFNNSLQSDHNILMVFFNGESLDYIGSSRLVWEITNGKFPTSLEGPIDNYSLNMSLQNIKYILEIGQITPDHDRQQYYLHVDGESYSRSDVKPIIDLVGLSLREISNNSISFPNATERSTQLPPSSLHSFLKIDRNIPALLLANHKNDIMNPFYNSFLDIEDEQRSSLLTSKFIDIVYWISNHLMNITTGHEAVKPDETLIKNMTHCFMDWPNWNCPTFKKVLNLVRLSQRLPINVDDPEPPIFGRTYPGVGQSIVRIMVEYILSFLIGQRNEWNEQEAVNCTALNFTNHSVDPTYSYTFMNNLFLSPQQSNQYFCVKSTMKRSLAKSPAFDIADYDLSDASANYSTWTESRWSKLWLRIYLKNSPIWEKTILAIGLISLIFWLLVGYCLQKHINILFDEQPINV